MDPEHFTRLWYAVSRQPATKLDSLLEAPIYQSDDFERRGTRVSSRAAMQAV